MPRRSQESDDEAYARALQEEYRKEFLRRQAEHSTPPDGDSNSNSNSNRNTKGSPRNSPRNTDTNTRNTSKKKKSSGKNGNPGKGTTSKGAAATGEKNRHRKPPSPTGAGAASASAPSSRKANATAKAKANPKRPTGNHGEATRRRRSSGGGGRSPRERSKSAGKKRRSSASTSTSTSDRSTSGKTASRRSASDKNLSRRSSRRSSSGRSSAGDDWLSLHYPAGEDRPPVLSSRDSFHRRELRRKHEEELSRVRSESERHLGRSEAQAPTVVVVGRPVVEAPWPSEGAYGEASWGASQEDLDAEYARRVQAECSYLDQQQRRLEEVQAASALGSPGREDAGGSLEPSWSTGTGTGTGIGIDNEPLAAASGYHDDDEAVARRIQQELADAEYARRIGLAEEQNLASQTALREAQAHLELEASQNSRKHCVLRWMPTGICLAVAVAVPLLFLFDVFDPSDVPFFGDLFGDDWVGNDPWSGTNMTIDVVNGTSVPRLPPGAYGWATLGGKETGKGLSLDLLNACSDDYQVFVQEAIRNWDEGSPIDSLTLYSNRIDYESECTTVTGKMKICNGDYGDTRWRGLNEVLLNPRQNTIVASTAKLNQYYLDFEGNDQKLYTCCHELGHGFGLPHWDESFFNKDLGNCMDYTQRPRDNMRPDDSNFLYLAQLYGGREVATGKDLSAKDVRDMVWAEKEAGPKDPSPPLSIGSLEEDADVELWEQEPGGEKRKLGLRGGWQRGRRLFYRTKRVLEASDDVEVHLVESDGFPGGLVLVRHYLLVRDDDY
ncbi:unnamed protein product [Pseudo-nitzschia multistriata]|uniref:Peptidase M10 metallopeptidase domain-containing protein n=1 Tax=Pseudo-nitzschia multistriata TaxID=183589 RepID=A0A448ZKY2_9STRA|nr:unnamed protein product [Pseudo-nitzschia multistriata]